MLFLIAVITAGFLSISILKRLLIFSKLKIHYATKGLLVMIIGIAIIFPVMILMNPVIPDGHGHFETIPSLSREDILTVIKIFPILIILLVVVYILEILACYLVGLAFHYIYIIAISREANGKMTTLGNTSLYWQRKARSFMSLKKDIE